MELPRSMELPTLEQVSLTLKHASFRTLFGAIVAGTLLLLAITIGLFILPYLLYVAV